MSELKPTLVEPRMLATDNQLFGIRQGRNWHAQARCLFPDEQQVSYVRNRELRRYAGRLLTYPNVAAIFAFFLLVGGTSPSAAPGST
jgi:hypothetical protein